MRNSEHGNLPKAIQAGGDQEDIGFRVLELQCRGPVFLLVYQGQKTFSLKVQMELV